MTTNIHPNTPACFVPRATDKVGQVAIPAMQDLPKKSSMIKGYAYDGTHKRLFVHFVKGNNVFMYTNVTRTQLDNLLNAESFGRHMNEHFIDNKAHKQEKVAINYTA